MPLTSSVQTGGPAQARRFVAAAVTFMALLGAAAAAVANPEPPAPQVSVREERGTYVVTARFDIPQSAAAALAVLSDYEQIPKFMPEVQSSVVVDRSEGRTLVQQEAVSRFMMFSKKVHLLLEVTREPGTIRFVDRCGKSFVSYQGAWRAVTEDGRTIVSYELSAKPGFDVPEFILKRLLKRDSAHMIERLRREIGARAAR
jgi:carbon monoxide dehydrogenase subunit G